MTKRASRKPANSKSVLAIRPPRGKAGLLTSTALVAGVLAGFGAVVATPKPALAAWAEVITGEVLVAGGDFDDNYTFDVVSPLVDQTEWQVGVGFNPGFNPVVATIGPDANGPILTVNANGESGGVWVSAGSSMSNSSSDGFTGEAIMLINPGDATNEQSHIKVNIDGTVDGSADANTDGIRVNRGAGGGNTGPNNAHDLTITITSTGKVVGSDDGIVVRGVTGELVINNAGKIQGTGDSNNQSEGITVLHNGQTGQPVAGNITIVNTGDILGGAAASTNAGSAIVLATAGNVAITNKGQVEGGVHGIHVQQSGNVYVANTSLNSNIGNVSGADLTTAGVVVFFNDGLFAGKTAAGLNIHDVGGTGASPNSVTVYNNQFKDVTDPEWQTNAPTYAPGILIGNVDGLAIANVTKGDIVVDNSRVLTGSTFNGTGYDPIWSGGGLIRGVTGNGVQINTVGGDVFIDNSGTKASNGLVLSSLLGVPDSFKANPAGSYNAGIWSGATSSTQGAVVLADVTGYAVIDNRHGVIGALGADGVYVDGIAGSKYGEDLAGEYTGLIIDNGTKFYSGFSYAGYSPEGGLIWGRDDAVDLQNIQGTIKLVNGGSTSTFFGVNDAIEINTVSKGDVVVQNGSESFPGGLILGLRGNAINIDGVSRTEVDPTVFYGGAALVNNYQARIFAGDTAVRIANVQNGASIYNTNPNSTWGSWTAQIFGDGQSDQPVIDLNKVEVPDDRNAAAALIFNVGGIISSRDLPGFSDSFSVPTAAIVPSWNFDSTALMQTFGALDTYIWGGSTPISIDSTDDVAGYDLEDYANAAGDLVIRSANGGSTRVSNDANSVLVGRVTLNGANAVTDGLGNHVNNSGLWLVAGENVLQQGLGLDDRIENAVAGWIQTAFNNGSEETSFKSNSFINNGITSLIDGESNDRTTIYSNALTGTGTFALDVSLAEGSSNSDRLRLRENGADMIVDPEGHVHLLFRRTAGDAPGAYGDQIDVVTYNGNVTGPAGAELTVDGDDAQFVIHSDSTGYYELGGRRYIEDGALGWYLVNDTTWDDIELHNTAGPGSANAPGVIYGLQNIGLETAAVVGDHIYGGQFRPTGGGGADPAYSAPINHQTSAWLKVGGSWINRETAVTIDPPGATLPVTSDQNIFSLLAGVDFKPQAHNGRVRLGVFGGYVSSSVNFNVAGANADYSGGSIGAYAAYNDGAFYADGTVKADFVGIDYTFAGTPFDTNGSNLGFFANTGYRMNRGNGWYLEPTAAFSIMSSSVDSVTGGFGTLDFDGGTSIRLGAGARIGTTIPTGTGSTEFSLLGRIWNEFGDANSVTATVPGPTTFTVTDSISGIFGEVAATATFKSANDKWSTFVSANGKFGNDISSLGASAGLRVGF